MGNKLDDYLKNYKDDAPERGAAEGHILVWLFKKEMSFTELSKRFANYDFSPSVKSRAIDQLAREKLIEVSTDKDTWSRFSKRGRPKRTLKITDKGREYIDKLLNEEENKDG